jgi:hypothetical protein
MVPAVYSTGAGVALHLDAFSSTTGQSIADTIVTNTNATTTADDSFLTDVLDLLTRWPPLFVYSSPIVPDPHESIPLYGSPPLPGVAVFADRRGGAPFVVVSDGMHDVVGYNFQLNPNKFNEVFRAHDTVRRAASGPMVLPDGHSAAGTDDGNDSGRITFPGPKGTELKDVKAPGRILGTPSRTANGEIVAVGYAPGGGFVTMLNRDGILHRGFTTGQTLASAAVSRNHIFVATASALATFEVGALKPIQLFPWSGGGMWPPAIGPDGRVYAIVSSTVRTADENVLQASNRLFFFPPPPASVAGGVGGAQSGGSIAAPH